MAADFLAMLGKINASRAITLDAEQSLFRQGEAVRWFYRIVSGRVRLSRVLARGSEITLARAVGGEILAEASVFATHYHCDAIAETHSEVRRYAMGDVRALLKSEPGAAVAYSAHLAA